MFLELLSAAFPKKKKQIYECVNIPGRKANRDVAVSVIHKLHLCTPIIIY